MSKRVTPKDVLHKAIEWKQAIDLQGGRTTCRDPSKVLYDVIDGFLLSTAHDRIEKEVFDDLLDDNVK